MPEITPQSQIQLSQRDFKLFQELMYEKAGIHLSEKKHQLVQSRLRKDILRLGLGCYRDYFNYLKTKDKGEELQHCINALTTNETFFFRHKNHWDYIAQHIIPEWQKNATKQSSFRVWSAAASSGEEAYSMAILFDDIASEYKLTIIGTDINAAVIQKAREACYSNYAVQKITSRGLAGYFDHVGQTYKVKRSVANKVSYRLHNLQQAFDEKPFDVIFIRNVMIYFDQPSKENVMSHLLTKLKVGGYLFLGGAETLPSHHDNFQYVKPTIYRKVR